MSVSLRAPAVCAVPLTAGSGSGQIRIFIALRFPGCLAVPPHSVSVLVSPATLMREVQGGIPEFSRVLCWRYLFILLDR